MKIDEFNKLKRKQQNFIDKPFVYSSKKIELAEQAKTGVYPCEKCGYKNCSDKCIAWLEWFDKKWSDIRKSAREKGWQP